MVYDPCGDLAYVVLLAQHNQPDDQLATSLERLFSYQLNAKRISNDLIDRLSSKPFHATLKCPPTEFLLARIKSLQDYIWHHVEPEERHTIRMNSLPKIASPPAFKSMQMLGMRSVVIDWVDRNPIDFELLSDAIRVETALLEITSKKSLVSQENEPHLGIKQEAQKKPNTNAAILEATSIGAKLIAQKSFSSQESLAKAIREVHGTCSTRAAWFKKLWKRHEEAWGKSKIPMVSDSQVELDELIVDQSQDSAQDTLHRKGHRAGNRRIV
jgi:hypothetical protein